MNPHPHSSNKFKVFAWRYENAPKFQTKRCLWVPDAAPKITIRNIHFSCISGINVT